MTYKISFILLLFLFFIGCETAEDCCELISYRFYNTCETDSVNYDIKFVKPPTYYSGDLNYNIGDSILFNEYSESYYYPYGTQEVSARATAILYVIRDTQTPDSLWSDTLVYAFSGTVFREGDKIDIPLNYATPLH